MADKKIEVRLLTPAIRSGQSQYKLECEADMVIIRTVTGDMGFLSGHEPCSVVLDSGVMRVVRGDELDEYKLAVLGGVAQMEDNVVTIISEDAEWPEDIDRGRAVALRDEKQALLDASESSIERDTLRREIKTQEVLITVSGFPASTYEKV